MIIKQLVRYWNSNWIYASKFDELSNMSQGKLCISPTALDINDVTLRIDIILCEDYQHTNNLLHSLKNKLQYIEQSPIGTDIIPAKPENTFTLSEELIELSQHLKYNQEMYSINKRTFDAQEMVRQHQEIRKYNDKLNIKKQLQDFKGERGYGYIIDLRQEQPDIMNYLKEGMNVIYLHPEGGRYIRWFLNIAEENRYPYQILPGPSELIASLAASGFPADRFGIEYFISDLPKLKVNEILNTRKKQCFSVCIYEELGNLEYILTHVEKIYGSHQMVFIKIEQSKDVFRKQVQEVRDFMKNRPLLSSKQKLMKCVIIVAPYAIEYNSQFKETEFQKHYLNELIHNDETTMIEVQKLTKKLEAFKEVKKYEIDSIKAAKYLLDTLPTEQNTLKVLQSLLRIGSFEAEKILIEAKKLPNDILQLEKK